MVIMEHQVITRANRGYLDRAHYTNKFERKLQADLRLAGDHDFHERYVSGYEFVNVPKFRHDANAWQEFVRSWCESVAVETMKPSTRSLVARAVRDAIEPDYDKFEKLTDEEIRDRLRNYWNSGDSVGDIVWARWPDDEDNSFYRGAIDRIQNEGMTIKYDDGDEAAVRRQEVHSIGKRMSRYFDKNTNYV
jgi:hypothetical protein